MLQDDLVTAGRAQLHFLRLRGLFIRGDARVAHLAAQWSTGSSNLGVSGHLERLRVRFRSGFPNAENTDNRSFGGISRGPSYPKCAAGRGGGFLEPRRLCQIHPESVAAALIFTGHLGARVSKLLLNVAFVDFS